MSNEKVTAKRIADREIQAMAEIDQILCELSRDAAQRVLLWIAGRHSEGPAVPQAPAAG